MKKEKETAELLERAGPAKMRRGSTGLRRRGNGWVPWRETLKASGETEEPWDRRLAPPWLLLPSAWSGFVMNSEGQRSSLFDLFCPNAIEL
uniref:Uncharacterized protein n=1 Tax=Vitis vinifera TaxID=29760 RepID=A5BCM1_VITVI|nr:hypothetical protein VITISV_035933 [Vitis vinifera]